MAKGKQAEVEKKECPNCDGNGFIEETCFQCGGSGIEENTCDECEGTGEVEVE